MNMKKRNIILFIAALMMGMTAVAQDLSSQRGESQMVPDPGQCTECMLSCHL